MKKIIIIVLTVITMVSMMILSIFAIAPEDVESVLEFNNTKKAYPIADSVSDSIGFFEYYDIPLSSTLNFEKKYEDADMWFTSTRSMTNLNVSAQIDGVYPNFSFLLINGDYNDFAICYENNTLVVVGIKDGIKTIVNEDLNNSFYISNENYYFSEIIHSELSEDYYIKFPDPKMEESLLSPITESIGSFVTGFGGSFLGAFTALFIYDSSINALGIILLVMFGITLGYGVIRWITGLFRKES